MTYNERILLMSNSTVVDLQIFLLGEFRIVIEKHAISPRTWRLRRARQLVKLLALAPQHRLAPEVIVESLWDNAAYDTARHSLHQVVHTARRALGSIHSSQEQLIVWENETIALCPGGGLWTDVEAFETAAKHARRAQTIETYRAALARYTADLLPEDPYAEWALARREELRGLHLALRVELAALYAQDRAFRDARLLLESVTTEDPLREDAQRALMQLDAREGKHTLALRRYQAFRARLDLELNVEPASETRALYETLRAARVLHAPSSNLPHALTRIIGRTQELAAIENFWRHTRLVTLVGAGGSGKTRLGLEAAWQMAQTETVYWVELAPLVEPALLPNVLATALNIQEQGSDTLTQRIVRVLRAQSCVCVLDNCEHLLDAVAPFLKTLLQQCPDLRILATSREALRVAGEQLWHVAPLDYPREISQDAQALGGFDAVRLFVERAQAVEPAFTLNDENARVVANICRRLDGLPLALELAAAHVNTMALEQIEAGLDHALALLVLGERAGLPRHQTLRAAVEWSYALLDDAEKKLWARLAVFAGGFSPEAAYAVCAGQSDNVPQAQLAALVSKSILRAQTAQNETRYSMLEVMRQFGMEKLDAAGETGIRRARHFDYYFALAQRGAGELLSTGQVEWFRRFILETGNLRAALEWARDEAADDGLLLSLSATLWRFWYARGWLSEGRGWLQAALARTNVANETRVQAMIGLGGLAWSQGDFAAANYHCETAHAIASRANNASGMAWSELVLAMNAQTQGDFILAAKWETRALEHFEESGEAFGKALTYHTLGVTAQTRGDLVRARTWFEASLRGHQALGNIWGAGLPMYALGMLAQSNGDWADAQTFFEQSHALFAALEAHLGIGLNANTLGILATERREFAAAADWLEQSIGHFELMGDQLGIARAWRSQAQLALAQNDAAAAHELARASLRVCAQIGDRVSVAESLEWLAVIAVAQNQFAFAAQWAGAAEDLRGKVGAPPFPYDHTRNMQILQRARDALGDTKFEREWRRVKTDSLPEIVRQAIET